MHWADTHSPRASPSLVMDTEQLGDWQEELLQWAALMLLLSALITAGLSVPQSKAAREIIACNYPPAQCSRSVPKQSFFQCLQEFVLVLFPDPTKPVPGMGLRKQMNPNFPLRTFVPGLPLLLSHTQFYDTANVLRTSSITVRQQQWMKCWSCVCVRVTPEHQNTQPLGLCEQTHVPHSQSFPQKRDRSCHASQTWGCRGQGCEAGQDTGPAAGCQWSPKETKWKKKKRIIVL